MLHAQVTQSLHQPDILLRPVTDHISSFDIKDFQRLIEFGFQSVKLNRKKIESIF